MARLDVSIVKVRDAVPADESWLQGLVENLANDERVAGTYSRQISREDYNLFTATHWRTTLRTCRGAGSRS